MKLVQLLGVFLFGVLATNTGKAMDRIIGNEHATRSEVMASSAMAATSQPLATQIALDIMKQGGNAIDAAIAANAALGLMEPVGCGIGGDLYAIVWHEKTQKLYGLNASGRSPINLSYDALSKILREKKLRKIPPFGMLPVSVPGAVDGWFELHKKFGRLNMKKILGPAIDYAKKGFPVSEVIAHYWSLNIPRIINEPGDFRKVFTFDGKAPKKGDIFRNPDLAKTYELIASNGRDAFYRGEIAKKIDAFMKSNGGYLRFEDFYSHRSDWVEPDSGNYRGYDVWELPPNGQGIAALQMLQILKQFDLKAMGYQSPEALHYLVEAKKLAFEDRAKFYADTDFNQLPIAPLISESYGKQRAKTISEKAAREVKSGQEILEQGDTIYLTTADSEGNMVSLIQSNYRGMGSGIVVPGTGFNLQDRGELFSLDPKHANVYAPGKRPFHTIIPAFVTKDGKPVLSFGVMGGGMQPQGHVQILTNIIDFGLNVQEAGDAPRWRHQGSTQPTGAADSYLKDGGELMLESGFPFELRRALQLKGHKLGQNRGGYGGYQAIYRDHERGVYIGASESRKDGQAAGY